MWFGSLSKTYSDFPDMKKKENKNLIFCLGPLKRLRYNDQSCQWAPLYPQCGLQVQLSDGRNQGSL